MKSVELLLCLAAVSAAPITTLAGYDIRSVPLPNTTTVLGSFGLNNTAVAQMMSNASDSRWAQRPAKGWSSSTDLMKGRMLAAINSRPTGMESGLANVVLNMCKAYARDPYHCALYATAVMCAESSCGQASNLFGRQAAVGSTKSQTVRDWIAVYNSDWYSANEGYHYKFCKYPNPAKGFAKYCDSVGTDYSTRFFYSDNPALKPFSAYCTSELSSHSPSSCPNGLRNSSAAYLRVR